MMRFVKRSFIVLLGIFLLMTKGYAKVNPVKEAEMYYNRGISINKSIKQAKKINANIDTSSLETEAIKNFSKAIELNPNFCDAYYQRAELVYESLKQMILGHNDMFYLMHFGFDSQVINDYQKVVELNPENLDAYCKKIFLQLYLYQGDSFTEEEYNQIDYDKLVHDTLNGVSEDIDKIISKNPMCANAYLLKALLWGFLYKGYDIKNDKIIFEEIDIHSIPEEERDFFQYEREKAYKIAIENLSTALSINPRLTIAYVYRSYFRFKLSDYQGGINDLTSAIKLEPQNALFYFMRAEEKSHYYLGDEDNRNDYHGAYKDYIVARNLSINKNAELYAMCVDSIEWLEKYHIFHH